jgi:hypothetical protein
MSFRQWVTPVPTAGILNIWRPSASVGRARRGVKNIKSGRNGETVTQNHGRCANMQGEERIEILLQTGRHPRRVELGCLIRYFCTARTRRGGYFGSFVDIYSTFTSTARNRASA